jgi:hypothetical protein
MHEANSRVHTWGRHWRRRLLGALTVTVSPDGLNVYAASYISDALAVFNRE